MYSSARRVGLESTKQFITQVEVQSKQALKLLKYPSRIFFANLFFSLKKHLKRKVRVK